MDTSYLMFKDVMLEWLRLKSRGLKANTAYTYRLLIERRLVPEIGHLPLEKITLDMLEVYIDSKSLADQRNYRKVIKPTMEMARRRGWIQYNPCDDLSIQRRRKTPIQVYTVDEVRKLIAAANSQWKKDVIEFAFRTGMRPGEIFALQWNAVDFRSRRIIVQASCAYAPEQGVVTGAPKTDASIRCIDIDHACLEILRHTPHISDFVFSRKNGEPRHCTTMQMYKLCDKAGIPRRDLRQMRSTHISILIENGIGLPEIQRRVGHAYPETLLRYYAQFSVGSQSESVNVFESMDLYKQTDDLEIKHHLFTA